MAFAIATCTPDTTLFCRVVAQAYLKSSKNLTRDVYIRDPRELGLPPNTVIKFLKPLYGIPEAVLHWYLRNIDHHIPRLGMRRTTVDPYMLVRKNADGINGLVILQVDDSFAFGKEDFLRDEESA